MNAKNPKPVTSRREKISRANSTVFIAVAIASVLVMFSLMSLRFLWNQKKYNDQVIVVKTTARDSINTNLDNLDKLAEQFPSLDDSASTNSDTILHALPPVYDYAGLASSMAFLARESGVQFTGGLGEDASISAVKSAPSSAPVEIPLTIEVKGSYSAVRRYISNLERSIRPVSVSSVTYSGTNSDLSASIVATTYYQPARTLDVMKEAMQ